MSKTKKNAVVGEVCLYGTREARFGFLASGAEWSDARRAGDGELRYGSMTDAILEACFALRPLVGNAGLIRVYAPGGEICATTRIDRPGYAGDLAWEAAPVLVLEVEALIAAAKAQDAEAAEDQDRIARGDSAADAREVRFYEERNGEIGGGS